MKYPHHVSDRIKNVFLVGVRNVFGSCLQTWKKLQVVQAALADILSKITLFWGHFELKIPHFWPKTEEEVLKTENWGLIKENWGLWWRIGDWEFRNKGEEFWIEDKQSKFEDFTMLPSHLIQTIFTFLCRESRYFEDVLNLWIFRLRKFYDFFQVWTEMVVFGIFCWGLSLIEKHGPFAFNDGHLPSKVTWSY